MKAAIFFVLLIATSWAQVEEEHGIAPRSPRAPQGHIQYSDPDGLKVSWKLYAPYAQWKSHLEDPQRSERAESGTAQPRLGPQSDLIRPAAAAPVHAAAPAPEEKPAQYVQPVQIHYKPFAMVPKHIKQLLSHMYEPQVPYVDPAVYIYQTQLKQQEEEQERQQQQQQQQQQAEADDESSQTQSIHPQYRYEQYSKYYLSKYPQKKAKVGFIQYKDEQPTAAASDSGPQYGVVPERQQYEIENRYLQPQQPQHQQQQQQPSLDDGMPKEIHQLLNLQAQTPYHVIANNIYYKPKSIFVPKPFKDDGKGPYKYRSKVYYVKDHLDGEQQDKGQPEQREETRELDDAE